VRDPASFGARSGSRPSSLAARGLPDRSDRAFGANSHPGHHERPGDAVDARRWQGRQDGPTSGAVRSVPCGPRRGIRSLLAGAPVRLARPRPRAGRGRMAPTPRTVVSSDAFRRKAKAPGSVWLRSCSSSVHPFVDAGLGSISEGTRGSTCDSEIRIPSAHRIRTTQTSDAPGPTRSRNARSDPQLIVMTTLPKW